MAYNGEGQRVALKDNGGTPTYYLGGLEEVGGGTLTRYFSAPGASYLLTAKRVRTSGALSYLASDVADRRIETFDTTHPCPTQRSSRTNLRLWHMGNQVNQAISQATPPEPAESA